MPNNTLPNRASDAGPEPQEMDWRDHIDEAEDLCGRARRAMAEPARPEQAAKRNKMRLDRIEVAISHLNAAKELLCK